MQWLIRLAEPRDVPILTEFNRRLAAETEGKKLDPAVVTRGVSAVFDDPKKGFYLVAEHQGEVKGQLMVTLEWSDWRDAWFWWIQSVYVAIEARRQGVFRQLYHEVIRRAQAQGNVIGVRLYVERDNQRAQQTYQQLGMQATSYLVFEQSPL